MAAELFKPFIIRRLIERGVVKTVKSAKKLVERKDPIIWDVLENILKGHPVLLNRAPTLHRLGIQAFQPKLIEGKAIQLHPLVCTAFNADFDGDQMAVHVPLSNAAIVEAQILMLSSHNILNPSNGTPIAVPSQDMVLGLYYLTKEKQSTPEEPVKGEGKVFYSPEEVIIAYNEGKVDLHAKIKVKINNAVENDQLVSKIIDTTVGRVIFNQTVPFEVGYINELLTKKALRDIIANVLKKVGMARTAQFLDDIKELGFMTAFRGGLSFTLSDITTPEKKKEIIEEARKKVEEVVANYNMGFITSKERYNQIIDIWTHANVKITKAVIDALKSDRQGFNPVYMMLDSGARGSNEQIKQLSGWRGLMAKPQKSGSTSSEFIENPIISNFREGLTVHEYFISTHGARKGLADTALKTADAGYLTRRLVDVAQDVIITEEDCGTLRGITMTALKEKDDIIESLHDRILGRVALNDVYHPHTGELLVAGGELIDENVAQKIANSPIESVEIRSVLTCESKIGVCAKCYGRNLGNGRMVQLGEAVGVIAAQSIGEPGTQLTLRTFHAGGTASVMMAENALRAKYDGIVEIDEIKTVETEDQNGEKVNVVVGRSSELRIVDPNTGIVLFTGNIPYGSILRAKNGQKVKKDQLLCEWDPYNAVIVAEFSGKVEYENIIENVTFHEEVDENTGFRDKVIIDSKDKSINPVIKIVDAAGNELKRYNIPVGAHIIVNNNEKIKAGKVLVKIPRVSAKSGDITGGLPRVTELFEARNPSDPAIVSEIDGSVIFGRVKRGSREIIIESKTGERRTYLIPLTKHILVQENDYVKAGDPLCDGSISLNDILNIKGPTAVQEYIVNEIQEVYRRQGQKLNDKHFEVIVRQMMRKVEIVDPGDTNFLEQQVVSKIEFMAENDRIYGNKVVIDPGDSTEVKRGQIISARKLREINSVLKRKDLKTVEARDAKTAVARPILQGITKASLQTTSWISAASFQETTKVLNEAAISAKEDELVGLKENVIVGHLIPAGTGLRKYDKLVVGSLEEYEQLMASKQEAEEVNR
jgi:DNA-directed RNA polymerase subunit beta'